VVYITPSINRNIRLSGAALTSIQEVLRVLRPGGAVELLEEGEFCTIVTDAK
jgi:hypothetical protein